MPSQKAEIYQLIMDLSRDLHKDNYGVGVKGTFKGLNTRGAY